MNTKLTSQLITLPNKIMFVMIFLFFTRIPFSYSYEIMIKTVGTEYDPGVFSINETDGGTMPGAASVVVANFVASDSTICPGSCINFTNLSTNSTTWQWTFSGAVTTASNLQDPLNICYNGVGAFTVQLIASNGLGQSDTMTKTGYISVGGCPPPVAAFSSSAQGGCDTVCIDFFDLSTDNPTQWHWYFPGATPSYSYQQNPTHICYTSDGLYDVSLVASNAFGSDSIYKFSFINVSSVPNAVINFDTTMHFGNSYQLLAGGGITYQWYPPDGLDTTTTVDPIATPAYTTTYYCLITDATGCSTIRHLTVYIIRDNRIFIPNSFSPNGDGTNDLFRIRGNNIFSSSLTVFDRWGEKVYESDGTDGGWDGNYNGKKLNAGIFSYSAFIVFEDGKTTSQTGTVALTR
jgi:gliding motility-associated-like protein